MFPTIQVKKQIENSVFIKKCLQKVEE